MKTALVLLLAACVAVRGDSTNLGKIVNSFDKPCNLPKLLIDEIAGYRKDVDEIINYVLNGPFKGKSYSNLAEFVDKYGYRMSGSDSLEQAIDYMIDRTRQEGIAEFATEEVVVPDWVRGDESAELLHPRNKKIDIIGLGYSISTPKAGITAEAIVVKDFDELEKLSNSTVKGKIIVYDEEFETYSTTVTYRSNGAARAAEKGAVAMLVRSVAPFSIATPHTGSQSVNDGASVIPAAAIAIEDADLLRRIQDRGEKIVLNVKLTSTYTTTTSRNLIVGVRGTLKPEQLVIVSGHIDDWDNGQGAMDDGGGLMISWAVPVILNRLQKRPKRTVQAILWTAEELGLIGARAYQSRHAADVDNINFIMESDSGTFTPLGLEVAASEDGLCIVAEVLKLFESINTTTLLEVSSAGSDIGIFTSNGVPGAELYTDKDKYFWFHHTAGDTMNVEDPDDLDVSTAFWAAFSYVIADISVDIPK